jgi:TolB-like protein
VSRLFAELKRRNVFRVAGVYAVVGWLLAQISTTLEEALGLPAWFDGLIVALLLLGLPIALVLAWAFELTPEGVVRTEMVPKDDSITARTGRKLDYAILAGLVLLGTFLAWQQVARDSSTTADTSGAGSVATASATKAATIAVLPFADLSPAGDQEYFSDGIAEEILNVLVGVDGLDIVSRTSSFQFKGRGLGIPEIAANLKVRHVVEGSVRKSGSTIRVTAQLIDAQNDKHLWSATYDRPLTAENIFAIQDEIANSIVAALSETLGLGMLETVQVTPTTRNLNAYELFLKARTLFQDRRDLDVVESLLAQAVEQDPLFAKAWEIRAANRFLAIDYGYSSEMPEAARAKAIDYAEHALAIDPSSSLAAAIPVKVAADANEDLHGRTDIAGTLAGYDKALDLDPRNVAVLNWRGLTFSLVGDLESALRNFETCMSIEPYYAPCVENHFTMLATMGRDEEALEAYRAGLASGSVKPYFAHLPSLARMGEELAFLSATNHPSLLSGWREHEALYDAYRHPGRDYSALIESLRVYFEGKATRGFEDFESVAQPLGAEIEIPTELYLWDSSCRAYRQTESFRRYVRAAGLLDYWHKAGFPNQCKPAGNEDFKCD